MKKVIIVHYCWITVPYCHGDSESKSDFLSLTELNGTIHQLEKKLENFEHLRQECSGKAIHIQVNTYAVLYYSLYNVLIKTRVMHPTRISPAYSTVLTVLCSRSNDQLHTVLYCATSLSRLRLRVDVIDSFWPPRDQNAICMVKYVLYI